MQEIVLKVRYFEKGSKSLKKVTLFFLSSLVPFNRKNYQKQRAPGTSDQSLFRLQKKFRKIPLLAMYYMTKFDDGIRYKAVFDFILKITSASLCKAVHDIINIPLPFPF